MRLFPIPIMDSWLSTWGMLAVPHVRLLYIELSFHSGRLDIQLKKYARPSINVWTGNGFGAEEGLKAFVTAVLFPHDCTTMTPERLEKVCEVFYEVGRIISNTEGCFLDQWLRRSRGADGSEQGESGRLVELRQVRSQGYISHEMRNSPQILGSGIKTNAVIWRDGLPVDLLDLPGAIPINLDSA